MRDEIQQLRLRFQECRQANAPLGAWREFQLEVLDAVKRFQRASREQMPASDGGLWALMGEAFWIERDQTRLAGMIEDVITGLEQELRSRLGPTM